MAHKTTGKPYDKHEESSDLQKICTLVLFNDDVNHYDFVVKSLVEVCNHKWEQAEQCTLIAHHKGKCEVKSATLDELKLIKDELTNRGLSSVIVEN